MVVRNHHLFIIDTTFAIGPVAIQLNIHRDLAAEAIELGPLKYLVRKVHQSVAPPSCLVLILQLISVHALPQLVLFEYC